MSDVSPTRMNLLTRRSQLGLAARGVDLLQKKRDALVREFFAIVEEALDARMRLNGAAAEAHRALLLAKAFDGPENLETLSLGVPALTNAEIEVENVWGTRVARLMVEGSGRAADTGAASNASGNSADRKATVPEPSLLPFSPMAVGGRCIAAQAAFKSLTRAFVRVANTESRLRRIGEEIKKTARRVNALEQAVIPGIRSQICFIQQVLDQQEQEDIFRLKRIKGKIAASRSQSS
jgi:V/A-type H+-transporting ATPase subunit D